MNIWKRNMVLSPTSVHARDLLSQSLYVRIPKCLFSCWGDLYHKAQTVHLETYWGLLLEHLNSLQKNDSWTHGNLVRQWVGSWSSLHAFSSTCIKSWKGLLWNELTLDSFYLPLQHLPLGGSKHQTNINLSSAPAIFKYRNQDLLSICKAGERRSLWWW